MRVFEGVGSRKAVEHVRHEGGSIPAPVSVTTTPAHPSAFEGHANAAMLPVNVIPLVSRFETTC
jgi:hypothetical protein